MAVDIGMPLCEIREFLIDFNNNHASPLPKAEITHIFNVLEAEAEKKASLQREFLDWLEWKWKKETESKK